MTSGTLKTLAIALATGDAAAARPLLAEHAEWEIVGRGTIAGRDAITATLAQARTTPQVTIGRVLIDGPLGVVEGSLALSPGHVRRFCDVYEFSSVQGPDVRRITSWDIRV